MVRPGSRVAWGDGQAGSDGQAVSQSAGSVKSGDRGTPLEPRWPAPPRTSQIAVCRRGSVGDSLPFRLSHVEDGAVDSVAELAADINAWVETRNQDPKPFVWTKTADQILDRLAGYCGAITGTEYVDTSS